jgi:kynurenine formamidase
MATLIDLSHPLEHGQLVYPKDPKIEVTWDRTVQEHGVNVSRLVMGSHQGTHLDAPFHFFEDGATLDQIPLERFFGPAELVDLAPGGMLEPKSPITAQMLSEHHGAFQPGAKVICRTGWHRMFGRPEFFADLPSLTLEAAEWIAGQGIGLLGMDTPTPSKIAGRPCHYALLRKGVEIVIVEGLANLDQLPQRFTFIGFPLNLKGRDGSPIRAVAWIP